MTARDDRSGVDTGSVVRRRAPRGPLVPLGLAAFLLLAPAQVYGQAHAGASAPAPDSLRNPAGRCGPDTALPGRDTVYLYAAVPDTGAQAFLPSADTLAAQVGRRLRTMLGGGPGTLPAAEPAITWRDGLEGYVAVVENRNGRAVWREVSGRDAFGREDSAVAHLVSAAMDSAAASGAAFPWPAGEDGDFVVLELRLGPLRRHARTPAGASGTGTLVFVERRPTGERPELISHPAVHYPVDQKYRGVEAHITLAVIIDTAGHPEAGSITDVLPDGQPSLAGQDRWDYEAFVAAARDVVRGSVYRPGRIGGCAVRVRVTIPFNFMVVRSY